MAVRKKRRSNSPAGNIPSLDSLYINPTRFCNLFCRHCWLSPPRREKPEKINDEEMSIGEIIDVVKEAGKLGLGSIKLTGGEPLLRDDIKRLLEFCAASDIEVVIETNGTLITRGVARMLRRFGVSHISVSLDSAFEERHDLFRGRKGAFRQAIRGIKNLCQEYFPPQVIMSLYRESLLEFGHFMRLMQELGVSDIKINVISYIGRGAELQDSGLVPTVREILDFSKRLNEIREDFQGSLFLDIPIAFKSLEDIKRRHGGLCHIKNILGILSDGSVSICGIGFVDERLLFGNVRDDPSLLGEIWRSASVLKSLRRNIPSGLEGVCGICIFKNRCLGNCRAEVYYNTGSLTLPFWFCQEAYNAGFFPVTRLIPKLLRA